MIDVSRSHIHWNYFIALENDLENLSRYIEFIDQNFPTYSIELAHLLLASSSEIDVVIKELCALISPDESRNNINDYRAIIQSNLPDLINEPIFIHRYGISVKPWENWNGDGNPNWWRSYNNVKHERNAYFHEANLGNVIKSIGALLITTFYYYKKHFERHEGNELPAKKVTSMLQHKSQFVQLEGSYYYNAIVM